LQSGESSSSSSAMIFIWLPLGIDGLEDSKST
jgi:hypothetical protein